jgi:membrane-associated phospholipid phosphatase
VGAEIVRQEYWNNSPIYGIAAYAVATGVGVLRVYNERHWATDVVAGAGFGILSAQIGYWMLPLNRRLFRSGDSQMAFLPYYTGQQGGLSLSYQF